jgi:hypothetical protein
VAVANLDNDKDQERETLLLDGLRNLRHLRRVLPATPAK